MSTKPQRHRAMHVQTANCNLKIEDCLPLCLCGLFQWASCPQLWSVAQDFS
jgi:hypothetical protein